MAELNALMAYKAVSGKLPVNVICVAEGDEERMDIGLRNFVQRPLRSVQGRGRAATPAALPRAACTLS